MTSAYKGLEDEWDHITSAISAARIPAFPATITAASGHVEWPQDASVDDFLQLAIQLRVELIYAEHSIFQEEDITNLEQRVAQGIDQTALRSSHAPIRGSYASIQSLVAPTTHFPELAKFMRRARAYIGRVWGFQVQWISLGVVHSYTRLADWYESLLDELPSLSALYTDIEIARDQELLNREQAQLEKRARQLASSPEFHKSPKTYTAQNRIALKHFPDISFNDLRALVRVAREIYELEVLPSYEKELAQRARSMLDEGSSRTKTAAKLGVSYSRLD